MAVAVAVVVAVTRQPTDRRNSPPRVVIANSHFRDGGGVVRQESPCSLENLNVFILMAPQ